MDNSKPMPKWNLMGLDYSGTKQSEDILGRLIPEWAALFAEKQRQYKDVDNSLGARGVFPDINRKVGSLKRYVWDGEEWEANRRVDNPREIILDLIGHLFLMLHMRDHELTPVGKALPGQTGSWLQEENTMAPDPENELIGYAGGEITTSDLDNVMELLKRAVAGKTVTPEQSASIQRFLAERPDPDVAFKGDAHDPVPGTGYAFEDYPRTEGEHRLVRNHGIQQNAEAPAPDLNYLLHEQVTAAYRVGRAPYDGKRLPDERLGEIVERIKMEIARFSSTTTDFCPDPSYHQKAQPPTEEGPLANRMMPMLPRVGEASAVHIYNVGPQADGGWDGLPADVKDALRRVALYDTIPDKTREAVQDLVEENEG